MKYVQLVLACILVALLPRLRTAVAAEPTRRLCRETRSFVAAEAIQGVAVDKQHVFAITNRSIGKYDKATGQHIATWQAPDDSPLKHLNSGVVIDGKLYCAHSNWPRKPLKNSIEIWDAASLRHIGRHEFDDREGALTWVDRHDGNWWIVFAYYGVADQVRRTTLFRLDDRWQRQASWRFPDKVVKRFVPFSNSGGSWGPDGLLYATGHDRAELYALKIPAAGKTLELVDIVPAKIAGQGIAWDRGDADILFGIRRKSKEVVVSRIRRIEN